MSDERTARRDRRVGQTTMNFGTVVRSAAAERERRRKSSLRFSDPNRTRIIIQKTVIDYWHVCADLFCVYKSHTRTYTAKDRTNRTAMGTRASGGCIMLLIKSRSCDQSKYKKIKIEIKSGRPFIVRACPRADFISRPVREVFRTVCVCVCFCVPRCRQKKKKKPEENGKIKKKYHGSVATIILHWQLNKNRRARRNQKSHGRKIAFFRKRQL